MSETVPLSDILLRDYVKDYVRKMKEAGKSIDEICDSIVEILYKIDKEEGSGGLFQECFKHLFRDWIKESVTSE